MHWAHTLPPFAITSVEKALYDSSSVPAAAPLASEEPMLCTATSSAKASDSNINQNTPIAWRGGEITQFIRELGRPVSKRLF